MAALAQFQLVHIHPFVDGNGRTSRLLSTLCLYRSGYDFKRLFTISEFYDRDRRAFYDAIQEVRDSGMDHTGWLEYFCIGLATQMHETSERGIRAIKMELVAREAGLSQRHADLLYFLTESPVWSIEELENQCPGTQRRTLQRDLKRLLELGLVKTAGHARSVRYALAGKTLE